MKALVWIFRFLVGGLFIFSGYVKAVDPIGTAYKNEQYFDILGLSFLEPFSAALAVLIIALEIVLGIALILGIFRDLTTGLLLLLIVFFTFLTGYTAYTGNPSDCGCFGDFIKLTPKTSFIKDLILLVMILVLFFGRRHITYLMPKIPLAWSFNILALMATLFTVRNTVYLPVTDFRPYSVGSNIHTNMELPEGAQEEVREMKFIYDVNGTPTEFSLDQVSNGEIPEGATFMDREDKVIVEGDQPLIPDLTIQDANTTEAILHLKEPVFWVVSYDMKKSRSQGWEDIAKLQAECLAEGGADWKVKMIGLSASSDDLVTQIKDDNGLMVPFFTVDNVPLKAMIRSNPGLVLVHEGVVLQKWSSYSIPTLEEAQEFFIKENAE